MKEMLSYDAEERAKRIREKVEAGIIPKFMIEEIVSLDSSIPEFAREEVIRLAKEA